MIRSFVLTSFVLLSFGLQAQVSAPEKILGFSLGSRFAFHHQIVDYFRHLESASGGRLKIQQYGITPEGRPLIVGFLTAPENMARLEEIRNNHLRSLRLLPGGSSEPPMAIAWLSYNVHGNEPVSANASMKLVAHLLRGDQSSLQELLKKTVIIVDPCLNPDGYERYVQWYQRVRTKEPDVAPYAIEHDEPWPGGRFNHYLFDLNRDWAWQTQAETQARVKLYNQWMPHVHADFHETTVERSYYFPPAAKPIHTDVTPWQRTFNEIIGERCRSYFDKNNWPYFTRYNYDLFYPGYGDTWPTFNGAVGVTYEQGGGGAAGLAIERRAEKDTLTLMDRIDHHFTTSLATLESIESHHDQLISEMKNYYERAEKSPSGNIKTYVVKAQGSEERVRIFSEWLGKQGFQFGPAGKSMSSKGVELVGGAEETVRIEPGDLLISAFQPKSNLLRVLFESKPFLEDSVTYDVTSWGISYLFGLKVYGLKEKLTSDALQNTFNENIIPSVSPFAYVARWQDVRDAAFLAELLRAGILVRSAEKPIEIAGAKFSAGTLIIPQKGNRVAGFHKEVAQIATRHGIKLTSVSSGFVTSGADFGSDHVRPMNAPKVVVLSGEGVSATALGHVWHFFEEQIHYPLTIVDQRKVADLPFAEIDVLILPDGKYFDILTERIQEKLVDWVRNGGKLIAMENATNVLTNNPAFGLTRKLSDRGKENADLFKKYAEKERAEVSNSTPGSIYAVTLDTTHPLAFGCNADFFTMVRDQYDLALLKDGWNVGYLKPDSHRAGFAGVKFNERLKNALIFGVHDLEKGRVVYLLSDPLFRGMFYDGKILFSNAVFR